MLYLSISGYHINMNALYDRQVRLSLGKNFSDFYPYTIIFSQLPELLCTANILYSPTQYKENKYESESRSNKENPSQKNSYSTSNSKSNKSNSNSSSSSYSDKSSMLYPYTINEIIKDKYMVINILY